MPTTIMPVFDRYPVEGRIIGRLLAGYGDLEFGLCTCVGMGIGDFDMAIKAMYRPRGESQRIEIADALGRKAYHRLRLGTLFEETIANMKVCLKIRNQFAHCNWHDIGGKLGFVDFQTIAEKNAIITHLGAL